MRLYDYGPSQNCFKVRLLAAQLNIVLDIVPVAIFKGEGALPGFLGKNPMGGVPVLETDTGKLDQFARDVATAQAVGNRALDVLDGELGKRPFIAGNTYTIADISIFAYSHVASDAKFDLSARPNLTTWFDRVRGQPGFRGEVFPYSIDPQSGQKQPFAM